MASADASSGGAPFKIFLFARRRLKGLLAAAVLAELDGDLRVTVVDELDLVVGTSTGELSGGQALRK
jgi:hypothetical protein